MNGNLWAKVALSHVLVVCTVRLMAGLAGNAMGREGHVWDLSHASRSLAIAHSRNHISTNKDLQQHRCQTSCLNQQHSRACDICLDICHEHSKITVLQYLYKPLCHELWMLDVLLQLSTAEITSLQTKIFNNIAVKLHAWISNTPVHATFAYLSRTFENHRLAISLKTPSVMNCECFTFSCYRAQPKSHLYKQRSSTTSLSNFMPESATLPCMRHLLGYLSRTFENHRLAISL